MQSTPYYRGLIYVSMGYRFILLIATCDEGTKEDVCAQARVGTDVLLVPPVFLVNGEGPLPFVGIITTNIWPVTEVEIKGKSH